MKRRSFLTVVGAGSVSAGALVGTGSFSRTKLERRVSIQAGSPYQPIERVTFSPREGDPISADEILHLEATVFADDAETDPIEIEWESAVEVRSVVLSSDRERFVSEAGTTAGTGRIGERGTGDEAITDQRRPVCDTAEAEVCGPTFEWDGGFEPADTGDRSRGEN